MYFEDLTPYTYSAIRLDDDAPSLVNFGWLDVGHDFPRAEFPARLADCVLRLAMKYAAGMRGFHTCPFCQGSKDQPWMPLGDKRVYLGSAEIRITAGDTTYVAPSLLPHYLTAHQYKPPDEVLRALESYCRD